MPDVHANRTKWSDPGAWNEQGDEWSRPWGGTDQMWWGALRPRIRAYVPAGNILEIAPGFGRWTQYLKDLCSTLVVVDLSPLALEQCRQRFRGDDKHVTYALTDGKSLDMVPDGSVDFAFSFDSLVHAERDVIDAYISELSRKLAPNGVAFIHHSNMATLSRANAVANRMPARIKWALVRRGLLINPHHWRAPSVSAEIVETICSREGLACISQEVVTWGRGLYLLDAISVFTPAGSTFARPLRRSENRRFMRQARDLAKLAPLYGIPEASPSEPSPPSMHPSPSSETP